MHAQTETQETKENPITNTVVLILGALAKHDDGNYEREKSENQSFMEFLTKLKEHPGSYRISSAHSKGLRRFLKKEYLNKVTGETVNSRRVPCSCRRPSTSRRT